MAEFIRQVNLTATSTAAVPARGCRGLPPRSQSPVWVQKPASPTHQLRHPPLHARLRSSESGSAVSPLRLIASPPVRPTMRAGKFQAGARAPELLPPSAASLRRRSGPGPRRTRSRAPAACPHTDKARRRGPDASRDEAVLAARQRHLGNGDEKPAVASSRARRRRVPSRISVRMRRPALISSRDRPAAARPRIFPSRGC